MRASQEFIKQLEELFQTYENEVKGTKLATNTANTHLYHFGNFVKWCRGEYIPGASKGKN
ncbi:hypothetical protein P9597_09430 [Aneurinibacillus migulanus]|uniref:hypothetical protein n=1 Tax=Aneurinibacillus migulanus TaxID=47500 RepID=UPI002E1B1DBA|nr:hypothetical protein [Aneurinibacillus migulanus]